MRYYHIPRLAWFDGGSECSCTPVGLEKERTAHFSWTYAALVCIYSNGVAMYSVNSLQIYLLGDGGCDYVDSREYTRFNEFCIRRVTEASSGDRSSEGRGSSISDKLLLLFDAAEWLVLVYYHTLIFHIRVTISNSKRAAHHALAHVMLWDENCIALVPVNIYYKGNASATMQTKWNDSSNGWLCAFGAIRLHYWQTFHEDCFFWRATGWCYFQDGVVKRSAQSLHFVLYSHKLWYAGFRGKIKTA